MRTLLACLSEQELIRFTCRYAAKAYVLFGEDEWWRVWDESYSAIMRHIRAPDGFWVSCSID